MNRHCRLLPREELNALAVRAKTCRDARDRVVEAVWPMVIQLAKRNERDSVSFEDLAQQGSLTIIRAVSRFKPSRGSFVTLLWWALVREFHDYIQRTAGAITRPRVTTERTKELAVRASRPFHIDAVIDDHWKAFTAEDPEYDDLSVIRVNRIRAFVETLSDRERYIFLQRQTRTLNDLSAELGITKERVRQIQMAVTRKTRAAVLAQEACGSERL